MLNITISYNDRERYEIICLDDIDKGETFVTEGEKNWRCNYKKETKNIIKKILLVKPESYNSSYHYNNVLESKKLDEVYEKWKIKLEKKRNRIFKTLVQ